MISLSIARTSGPIVKGQARQIVEQHMHEIVNAVGGQTLAEVMTNLNRSIKHPTPYYETQINLHMVSRDLGIVNDRGVIYGPWLEGVSRRNQTTRFKGYASFRRAKQTMETKIHSVIRNEVNRLMQALNGS